MWLYKYYDFSHTDKAISVCGKSFVYPEFIEGRGFPIEFGIRFFFWCLPAGDFAEKRRLLNFIVRNIKVDPFVLKAQIANTEGKMC